MRVVGLDLSLTSTGVCVAYAGAGWVRAEVDTVPSSGHLADSLAERWQRLTTLREQVVDYALPLADLVVVEAPAYSKSQGSAHDRSGLWWLVVSRLHGAGTPVVEVPPHLRPLYATGSTTAGKAKVVDAAARRYGHLVERFDNDDEADALVLAAMGARHLGHPLEASLPKANLAALNKVRWPDIPERTTS